MVTYKQAGVDIDAGNEVVRRIKKLAKGIGFFGGLFPFGKQYLVSGADGVGSKVKVAIAMNRHETIGIDLVAMNVDDVVACGAKPLFFLDYIGCHKVNPSLIEKLVKGMVIGCKQAECELLGGETAELPDLYREGEYDLAGFAVGAIDKKKVINGSRIKEGDKIIGLASSGLHSNGYTMARKVLIEHLRINPKDYVDDLEKKLGEELLIPTRIYAPLILELVKRYKIKGIAHITGGGIPENLARVIPSRLQAVIDINSWHIGAIFRMIQNHGKVSQEEMYRTFNMGLGMVLVVDKKHAERVMNFLAKRKEKAYLIGEIGRGKGEVIII
jgi:phosphoribosylformylglycinamidine cyclo-ligase